MVLVVVIISITLLLRLWYMFKLDVSMIHHSSKAIIISGPLILLITAEQSKGLLTPYFIRLLCS